MYRIKRVGDSWDSWTEMGGSYISIYEENRWSVEVLGKDTAGAWSDEVPLSINFDTQSPQWQDNKHTFWNRSTQGYEKVNNLSWNVFATPSDQTGTIIADAIENTTTFVNAAGLYKAHLYRSSSAPLNSNPNFEHGRAGATPDGYDTDWDTSTGSFRLTAKDAYNDKYCGQLDVSGGGGGDPYVLRIISDTGFNPIQTQHTYFARVKSTCNATVKLCFRLGGTQDIRETMRITEDDGWLYIEDPISSSRNTYSMELEFSGDKPWSGSATFWIDEFLLANLDDDEDYPEINSFTPEVLTFSDTDVSPWEHYIYYMKYEDNAGIMSPRSNFKYCRTVENWRDKLMNILDNSSFERYELDGDNNKIPTSWATWFWYAEAKSSYTGGRIETNIDEAYHGSNYYVFAEDSSVLAQNDIVVLPYIGRSRNYVLSCYAKKNSSASATMGLAIMPRDNEHGGTTLYSTTFSLTTSWERYHLDYSVSSSDDNNLSIAILANVVDASIWVDAIKLEETESTEPSEYWDTKSVTADFLQGSLIRGHLIEADTITANKLNVNALTVGGNLASDTVSEAQIVNGEVTGVKIEDGAITAGKIAVGEIETDHLQSFSDKHIYVKDKGELLIELDKGEVGNNPVQVSFALCTMYRDYKGVVYDSALTDVTVFDTSHTFNYSNVLSSPTAVGTLSGYKYPLIGVTYPQSGSGGGLIVCYTGVRLYSSYVSFATDHGLYNGWTTPLNFYTTDVADGDAQKGVLKYYNGYYYYSVTRELASAAPMLFKLTTAGAQNDNSSLFSASPKVVSMSFDIDASGNILIIAAKENSTTLYFNKRNATTITSSGTTFTIPTYSGFSASSGMSEKNVTSVSICHGEDDTWIITYRLLRSNLTYFKVIDSSGSILVNDGIDMALTNNSFYMPILGGAGQLAPRMLKSYNGDALFYIPSTAPFTLSDAVGGTQPLAGKAVYLSNTPADIDLFDLFGRTA